jgi:phosphatidylinositol glycan class N
MNSVGVLPLAYLKNTLEYQAKAIFGNALAIYKQFQIKGALKEKTEIFFQPFQPLALAEEQISNIKRAIEQKNYKESQEKSVQLINMIIDGMRYYQTYDWFLLRSIVSAGYLGWIAYSVLFIIKTYSSKTESKENDRLDLIVDFSFFLLLCGFFGLLYYKESPLTYYLYAFFPLFFWKEVAKSSDVIKSLWDRKYDFKSWANIVLYVASLEVLVLSYFYRWILSICIVLMGFIWPMTMPSGFRDRHYILLRYWRILCLITSVFTTLPVGMEGDLSLM